MQQGGNGGAQYTYSEQDAYYGQQHGDEVYGYTYETAYEGAVQSSDMFDVEDSAAVCAAASLPPPPLPSADAEKQLKLPLAPAATVSSLTGATGSLNPTAQEFVPSFMLR